MAGTEGANTVRAAFRELDELILSGAKAGVTRVAMLARRESVRNAPRSPTQAQKDAGKKINRQKRRKLRKANSHSRPKPGGLERSIKMESNIAARKLSHLSASIFVPANAEAAKYARFIHDEKGKKWRRRGKGTIAKGSRADEKFIARALFENSKKFQEMIASEIARSLKGW